MNSLPCPQPTSGTAAPTTEAPPQDIHEREREVLRLQLEHRFRHSLRSGQLNPLLHLVMRYKLERGA